MAILGRRNVRGTSPLPDNPDESEVLEEIHGLIRRSVAPYRAPTSNEMRERLPELARIIWELAEEEGLSDEDACAIFESLVSRVLETQLSERLSETLSNSGVSRERPRMQTGRFGQFAMSNGLGYSHAGSGRRRAAGARLGSGRPDSAARGSR